MLSPLSIFPLGFSGFLPMVPFNQKSFLFDGVDAFLSCPIFGIANTNNYTMAAWVKRTAVNGQEGIMDESDNTIADAHCRLRFNGSDVISLKHESPADNDNLNGNTPVLVDGLWHLVLGLRESDTVMRVYLDGVEDDEKTNAAAASLFATANTGLIGARTNNSGNVTSEFNGNIDSPAVWNRALTPAEITELWNNGSPMDLKKHSASANLIRWYRNGDDPLDDATGTTGVIKDQVGANDATPMNTQSTDIVEDVPKK